jgi:putative FmdB family regulatory protein
MPMYTFHCAACGNEFELFLRPSEASRGVPCPVCGERPPGQPADCPAGSPDRSCDLAKKT